MSPSTKYPSKAPGCMRCGRAIVFVQNLATGKHMPAEPVPDEDGTITATRDGLTGKLIGWVISAEHPHRPGNLRYMAHGALCPVQKRSHKPKAEPAPTLFDAEETP